MQHGGCQCQRQRQYESQCKVGVACSMQAAGCICKPGYVGSSCLVFGVWCAGQASKRKSVLFRPHKRRRTTTSVRSKNTGYEVVGRAPFAKFSILHPPSSILFAVLALPRCDSRSGLFLQSPSRFHPHRLCQSQELNPQHADERTAVPLIPSCIPSSAIQQWKGIIDPLVVLTKHHHPRPHHLYQTPPLPPPSHATTMPYHAHDSCHSRLLFA